MNTRYSRVIAPVFIAILFMFLIIGCVSISRKIPAVRAEAGAEAEVSSSDRNSEVAGMKLPAMTEVKAGGILEWADSVLHPASAPSVNIDPVTHTGPLYASAGTLTVTAAPANVRTDAGAEFQLVTTLGEGAKYPVIGQKDAANAVRWFQIDLGDGRVGYVCGNYVSYDGPMYGARAYLTFDDGPSENTMKILDILDNEKVKATFFVIYHPDCENYYREIVKRGHTIALHSWSHDYATIYKSETAYFNDLDRLADYIEKVTGERPTCLRFPGGSSNTVSKNHCSGIMTKLAQDVEAHGYSYHDWNVNSGDAEGNNVPKNKLIARVKEELGTKSNAVVLMHDTSAKKTTVEALPEIIRYIRSKGYTFYALDDRAIPVHHTILN